MERDYYSILGVSRFASQQALRRAYRARILEVHPDRNPTDRIAADRARDVIEAYRILHDPESRRRYDLSRFGPAPRVMTPVYAADDPCPQWVTRFFAILLFFALTAGLLYVIATALADDTPVWRPSLGTIDVASGELPSHHSACVSYRIEIAKGDDR